ncbi:MAG: ceramidase domain-containing protein [Pseudomonadota bacterium]
MMQKIFAYCERGADPSYWAEPVNAITNAAFIVAALAALALWRSARGMLAGVPELLLIIIVFAIGVGSYLFHTHAEGWAALADTLPIGIFMVGYLGYALRRYFNWDWINTLVALGGFFLALAVSSMVRCDGGACFNGSAAYFPALIALLLIGGILILRGHGAGGFVLGAGLVFAVSLTLRTLDRDTCGDTIVTGYGPLGTHFGWHTLNAVLLYLLLRAAIIYGPRLAPNRSLKPVDPYA